MDLPGGILNKKLPVDAGDMDSIPGPGRFHMLWAAKPMHHNYWSLRAEGSTSHNYWARVLQLLKCVPRACAPQQKKPHWQACSPQLEKTHMQQQNYVQPKIILKKEM